MTLAAAAKYWGTTPSRLLGVEGTLSGYGVDVRLMRRLEAESLLDLETGSLEQPHDEAPVSGWLHVSAAALRVIDGGGDV